MPTYHVLNGDCLADQLKETAIDQDFIICRECLIDGTLESNNLTEFWDKRMVFFAKNYDVSANEYQEKTILEFEKLKAIPAGSELCLWFEDDLFCQANMWFVISLLSHYPTLKLSRVFPPKVKGQAHWKGFGLANAIKLQEVFDQRIEFEETDIQLGLSLWKAYCNKDFEQLKMLSSQETMVFHLLEEVCQAHMDRFPTDGSLGRPEVTLAKIMNASEMSFAEVFKEFSKQEGIYGFGDLQLKGLFNGLLARSRKA